MLDWLSYSDWSLDYWLEDGRVYGALLWIGLAVLTFALLILMRTRWGQARPLSKCVGLSVFAHMLFLTFAYTTHWFEAPPPLPSTPGKPIRVRMFSQEPAPTVEQQAASPWDASQSLAPGDIQDLGDVPRPRLESDSLEEPQPASERSVVNDEGLPQDEQVAEQVLAEAAQLLESAAPREVAPTPDAAAAPPAVLEDPLAAAPLEDADQPPAELAQAEPAEPEAAEEPAPSDASSDSDANLADLETNPEADVLAPQALTSDALEVSRDLEAAPQPSPALDQQLLADLAEVGREAAQPPPTPDPLGQLESPAVVRPVHNSVAGEPLRLGDGQPLPTLYRARLSDRLETAIRFGGSQRTEQAVSAALRWLAENQSSDGRWSAAVHGAGREEYVLGQSRAGAGSQADTGVSGLALLAFLAAGHTHLEGDYQAQVSRGLAYLRRIQGADGNLAGQATPYARTYCHGMAFLALSEAYGMTGDAHLRDAVQRASQYTIRTQHPSTGGWRYLPQSAGDTSQFGWQAMALRSAELGGLPTPDSTRVLMERFLRSVAAGPQGGLASYRTGEAPSAAMTAEALACRTLLQLPTTPEQTQEALNFLLQRPPVQANQRLNLYGMYYATLAVFQQQGDAWVWWNRMMQDRLLPLQEDSGAAAGSWSDQTLWGGYGGRVYTTATAALCLEVYYRYLPVYSETPARTARR